MNRRDLLWLGATLGSLAALAPLSSRWWLARAMAQSGYPDRPVRIVVDSAVGRSGISKW
jgi:hypothetical protein